MQIQYQSKLSRKKGPSEVIKTFGESILNEDKSIDRKKLAEIFTSEKKTS